MKVLQTLPPSVLQILKNNRISALIGLKLRKNGVYGKAKKSLLHLACKYSNIKLIKYCLINLKLKLTSRTKKLNAPLHYCCKSSTLSTIKFVFKSDPSQLNSQNKKGQTPLLIAAKNNREKACIYLVYQKANLHIQDKNGWAVGHWAAANAMLDLLKVLQEKSYNFLMQNWKKENMLHFAAWNGNIECFEYIFQYVSIYSASLKGDISYYCKGNWELLIRVICKGFIKLRDLKKSLLAVKAPLALFEFCKGELKTADVLNADREDILAWMFETRILDESSLKTLSSMKFIKPKCYKLIHELQKWNKAKLILFLHCNWTCISRLPIGLVREIIEFIR